MKLRDVVVEGKFCGLETVEECVTNYYIHRTMMMPDSEIANETKELEEEIRGYEEGILTLDMAEIDAEVARMDAEYNDFCEQMEYDEWHKDNVSDPRLELLG